MRHEHFTCDMCEARLQPGAIHLVQLFRNGTRESLGGHACASCVAKVVDMFKGQCRDALRKEFG